MNKALLPVLLSGMLVGGIFVKTWAQVANWQYNASFRYIYYFLRIILILLIINEPLYCDVDIFVLDALNFCFWPCEGIVLILFLLLIFPTHEQY